MDHHRHQGKVAIVTGGAHGIGAATVRRLLAEGAAVMVADINIGGLNSLVTELNEPDQMTTHQTDVASLESVEGLVAATVQRFGQLDILVNNAGLGVMGTVEEISPVDWDRVMAVSLNSVFYGARIALPHLRKTKGNIVNTASISGLAANRSLNAYYAAKAGVVNFTRYLAIEHAHEGIRVNAVCPGPINTRPDLFDVPGLKAQYDANIPAGRVGVPDEVASGISFLASNAEASYISGHALVIDGALTAWTGEPDQKPFHPDRRH